MSTFACSNIYLTWHGQQCGIDFRSKNRDGSMFYALVWEKNYGHMKYTMYMYILTMYFGHKFKSVLPTSFPFGKASAHSSTDLNGHSAWNEKSKPCSSFKTVYFIPPWIHQVNNNVTSGPWATMLTWVNSYNSLIQHFWLSVAMATNQNEEFVQLLYAWWRTTQQTFIKKVLSKYLQWDSNKDLLSLFSSLVNGNFKLP